MRLTTLLLPGVFSSRSLLELVGLALVLLRALHLVQRLGRAAGGLAGDLSRAGGDPLAAAFQQDLRRRGLLPSHSAETS